MVLARSAAATTISILFGGISGTAARRANYQPILDQHADADRDDDDDDHRDRAVYCETKNEPNDSTPFRQQSSSASASSPSSLSEINNKNKSSRRPAPGSWADFFFGFLYEDDYYGCDGDVSYYTANDDDDDGSTGPMLPFWRRVPPLHWALSAHLFLLAASTASAVTVATAAAAAAAQEEGETTTTTTTATLSARMTSAAVLGTALGKLCLGSVPDVVGARRTAYRSALGVAAAWGLVLAAAAPSPTSSSPSMMPRGQFWMEFGNAVQWPCAVVVLAAHHHQQQPPQQQQQQQQQQQHTSHSNRHYEAGIFLTSLASRLGSLVGMVVASRLQLHHGWHWRVVAGAAAWWALVAASITYLYVPDAPDRVNAPQNPVDPHLLKLWFPPHRRPNFATRLARRLPLGLFVARTHALPALRRILGAPTVWILALAHTGGLVVRTSERVLPQYARATATAAATATTSNNDSSNATTTNYLAVGSSVGTVLGLIVLGRIFAAQQQSPRARKWMVWRLYLVAVAACYALAVLAIPAVHRSVGGDLAQFWQLAATAVAGFCVAVPCYHLPSLVAAGFGRDKGLFLAYTDGIAYGLASLVWKFVLGRTSVGGGDGSSSGWAYGWAAVALLLLVSGVAMTEFMEHYFCRPRHGAGGTYETIILA